MLIVGFTSCVLVPALVLFAGLASHSSSDFRLGDFMAVAIFVGCMFGGPVVLLLILDAVSKRVIADMPTKFGPKIAAVGKWSKAVPVQGERTSG